MTVIWSGTVDAARQRADQRPASPVAPAPSSSPRVLAYLRERPGTIREIATATGIAPGTVSNVIGGLLRGGYVETFGSHRQVGVSGRPGMVYRVRAEVVPLARGSRFACEACGYPETRVTDTRPQPGSQRRVRVCPSCAARVETIETFARYLPRRRPGRPPRTG